MAIEKEPSTVDEKSSPIPYDEATADGVEVKGNVDALQRHLGNRQIQLIAIGGSVGTALFVSIGGGLMDGGPGSLLIAYALYSGLLGLVNNSMAEMAVYMPISGMLPCRTTVSHPSTWHDTLADTRRTSHGTQALLFVLPASGSMMRSASWPVGTFTSTRPP